jgi:hypothetical protein
LRVPPFFFLLRAWFAKQRGLLLVTFAALAVRLVWNVKIHRLIDFAYSDRGGYLDRANQMIDKPSTRGAWLGLYPYGTHYFIYAVKWLFGRKNEDAVGAGYALLGTLAVSYTYATAERYVTRRWARALVGMVLIGYYPWISLGGYALSEIPFTFCVAGAAFYGLRFADEGRRGDAWLLGLFYGIGAAVRPQILVAAVFLGLHFLLRRSTWKHFTPGRAVRAAVPLLLVLGLSAYRLHQHTDHYGLISTNGPLNFVFGRCHNTGLDAVAPGSRGFFGPPALGSLLQYERTHKLKPPLTLDPIFGETLVVQGHMWDAEPNYKLAAACVKTTGVRGQIKYALTHVMLLWGYNIIWPDAGQKPQWRVPMEVSSALHNVLILPAAALAVLLAIRRRRARSMLLALHVLSVLVTSMLYFGDTRYRAPYDGILIVLAAQSYVQAGGVLLRGWDALRQRMALYRLRRAARRAASGSAGSAAPLIR